MEQAYGSFEDFQPNRGGMEIRQDSDQTQTIIIAIRFGVRLMAYWNGRVITKYLSILIVQRFKMDAVHMMTSEDVQRSHMMSSNGQYPSSSYAAENGMARTATSRSESAKDTISKFDGVCKRCTMATAIHTNKLPIIVPIISRPNAMEIKTCCHTRYMGSGGPIGTVTLDVILFAVPSVGIKGVLYSV